MKNAASEKSPAFRRTDKAIQNAFITLLKRKPFEEIIVSDILKETPVTRSTFYQHYHDKYEVAERMLEEYQQTYTTTYELLCRTEIEKYPSIIYQLIDTNRELMRALLKIHTDRVDLQKSMVNDMRTLYLRESDSPNASEEAGIYAQIMVEIQLLFLQWNGRQDWTGRHSLELIFPVMLKIFHLENDQETIDYLKKKIFPDM